MGTVTTNTGSQVMAGGINNMPGGMIVTDPGSTSPIDPLTLVAARAIDLMTVTDRQEVDHKVVAVHVNDPEFDIYQEARELPQHRLAVLKRFFKDYKVLENREVIVGDILPAKEAEQELNSHSLIIEVSLADSQPLLLLI